MLISVGILTFISMLNTTIESLKARRVFIQVSCLVFMSRQNFMLGLVEHEKSFITSGPSVLSSLFSETILSDWGDVQTGLIIQIAGFM